MSDHAEAGLEHEWHGLVPVQWHEAYCHDHDEVMAFVDRHVRQLLLNEGLFTISVDINEYRTGSAVLDDSDEVTEIELTSVWFVQVSNRRPGIEDPPA